MKHVKLPEFEDSQAAVEPSRPEAVAGHATPPNDDPSRDSEAYESDDMEIIDDEEGEAIGDLGGAEDGALDLDAVMLRLDGAQPTRFSFLLRRASDCMKALAAMRAGPASPWPQDRVPEAHWRALADEALGLIGSAVKKEFDDQAFIQSLPQDEREDMRRLLDSSLGMQIFRDAFERERAGWEKAFWRMALDQSFGKKAWTGPSGWRRVAGRGFGDSGGQVD